MFFIVIENILLSKSYVKENIKDNILTSLNIMFFQQYALNCKLKLLYSPVFEMAPCICNQQIKGKNEINE